MSSLRFFANLAMLLCSASAFIYGIFRYYGRKVPLYFKAVITGLGCFAGGRLATVILMFSGASIGNRFNIGHLGFIGFSLFLFTSNHGILEEIFKRERIKKGRFGFLAFLAPLVLAFFIVSVILADNCTIPYKITCFVFSLFICFSAYYNLHYLVNHTAPGGVIRSLRLFNIDCLILYLAVMGEMYMWTEVIGEMIIPIYALMGVSVTLILPLAERSLKYAKKEDEE